VPVDDNKRGTPTPLKLAIVPPDTYQSDLFVPLLCKTT
jgi:hypothetical protein